MNDKNLKPVATLFLSFLVNSKMAFMYCRFIGVLIHLHISVAPSLTLLYELESYLALMPLSNQSSFSAIVKYIFEQITKN